MGPLTSPARARTGLRQGPRLTRPRGQVIRRVEGSPMVAHVARQVLTGGVEPISGRAAPSPAGRRPAPTNRCAPTSRRRHRFKKRGKSATNTGTLSMMGNCRRQPSATHVSTPWPNSDPCHADSASGLSARGFGRKDSGGTKPRNGSRSNLAADDDGNAAGRHDHAHRTRDGGDARGVQGFDRPPARPAARRSGRSWNPA